MAPSGIERIDNDSGKLQFENRLHPADIKLSEAMATSAAAISYHMGQYESKLASLQSIQIMLGLGFGKSQIAEPKEWTGCLSTVLACHACHVTVPHAISIYHVTSCLAMSCHVMMLFRIMSCHFTSCHVMPCLVMSCNVRSCHVITQRKG